MANKYLANSSGRPVEVEGQVQSAGLDDAGKIPALDAAGRLDESLMPTGVGADVQVVPASEALAGGDFVNVWNDSGALKARKADATTNGKPADGFVKAAVESGSNASVYRSGENDQRTGLTVGATYWLSTTPGAVTETPPDSTGNLVQIIGKSYSATELAFNPQEVCTVA